MSCGCSVNSLEDIVYCETHRLAPSMLQAIRKYLAYQGGAEVILDDITNLMRYIVHRVVKPDGSVDMTVRSTDPVVPSLKARIEALESATGIKCRHCQRTPVAATCYCSYFPHLQAAHAWCMFGGDS